jgi:uncharacterized protein (TIGR03435 family)
MQRVEQAALPACVIKEVIDLVVWRLGGVKRIVLGLAIIVCIATGASALNPAAAQGSSDSARRFDVASIKSNSDASSRLRMQRLPGGGLAITAATVRDLVRFAFAVDALQVYGSVGWMNSERFDILAKLVDGQEKVTKEQSLRMLQSLLAERFQLKVHKEYKEMPAYVLTVGPEGHKLNPMTDEPKQPTPKKGTAILRTTTTSGLASALTSMLGRVVVDETHLSGDYDILLEYSPVRASPDTTLDGSGPSVSEAVRDELGLRLVSRRAPVEVITIDRVERPVAN